MNNQKPVWRMGNGFGVSDALDNALFYHGNIVAYQTTRTKPAKYERVECFKCNNSRFKGLVFCGGYFEYKKCPHCKGKGYRLERIK